MEGEYRGLQLRAQAADVEHRGYLEEAGAGRLVVQHCESCDRLRASFNSACPFCLSTAWAWWPVSGKGHIYSWGIVMQAVHPAFKDWTPYPIVLVELDEQRDIPWENGRDGETISLRISANLVQRSDVHAPELEANVRIGAPVEACFVPLGNGLALPQFTLVESEA
jgi:uncharacterized protein